MITLAIDDELGPVRFCLRCREWWPDDRDFYRSEAVVCIACTDEVLAERRARHWARVRRSRERRKMVTA